MSNSTSHYKVLPFKTPEGKVEGHEITTYHYEWMGTAHVSKIIFERWDETARMMINVMINYQAFTEYTKKSWPKAGRITGVVLSDNTLIHAEDISAAHYDNKCYLAAPIIARDCFRIRMLSSKAPLIEVRGVNEWLHSKRDAAATAKFLACPWERDNAIFAEEMKARGAEPTAP